VNTIIKVLEITRFHEWLSHILKIKAFVFNIKYIDIMRAEIIKRMPNEPDFFIQIPALYLRSIQKQRSTHSKAIWCAVS